MEDKKAKLTDEQMNEVVGGTDGRWGESNDACPRCNSTDETY